MQIHWNIVDSDVERVKSIVSSQSENGLVIDRQRNLETEKAAVNRARFWPAMVCMRLTSQQRSGPKSPVSRFMQSRPFPLSYDSVMSDKNKIEAHITNELRSKGIRFVDKIAAELGANFRKLEQGEWDATLSKCNQLTSLVEASEERVVAHYIASAFKGFGPKQSRNLLQALRLTRYEIPIDSRVIEWLNLLPFPIRLTANALGDSAYYDFVSDGIIALCEKSGILPCTLDASIFAVKDKDGWTSEIVKLVSFD